MAESPDYDLDATVITGTREWSALMAVFAKMHVDLMEDLALAVDKNDMHTAALVRGKITMLREMVAIDKYISFINAQRENENGRRDETR